MKYVRSLFFAAVVFLGAAPAVAQWQTPSHSVPLGLGGGNIGFSSATPGTAGYPLTSNGTAADPSFQPVGAAALPQGTAGYALTGNGAAAPTYQGFKQSGFIGNPTVTWQAKAENWKSITDFGCVSGGTTAVNNACFTLAMGQTPQPMLYVPCGTYSVSQPITITQYSGLIGAGRNCVTIQSTAANTPVVYVNSSLFDVELRNLTISRTVAATAGGTGIDDSRISDRHHLSNLIVKNQYVGVAIGNTGYSTFDNSWVFDNYSHGVQATTNAPIQWQVSNVLSGTNNGDGFHFECSGVGSASMGNHSRLASYANAGYGYYALGNASCPVEGIRLADSFFGNDGLGETVLDTYGTFTHTLSNVVAEAAGTSSTGRGIATPATNAANGFVISVNNPKVSINSPVSINNSYSGMILFASTTVIGGIVQDNGLAASAGNDVGIVCGNAVAATRCIISGVTSGNSSGGVVRQKTGLAISANTDYNEISLNDFRSNTTQAILNLSAGLNNKILLNAGATGTLPLADGGTAANLSATGGASQVLRQSTLGGAVTVSQLACANLSTAAASCSTDTTNAANISSGLLAAARGGQGSDFSGCTGMPVWAAGVVTCTATTGTGAPVRAGSPAFTGTITGVGLNFSAGGTFSTVTANAGVVLLSGITTPQLNFTSTLGGGTAQFYADGSNWNIATSGVGDWFRISLAAGLSAFLNSTDASSATSASLVTAGGFGAAKGIWAGTFVKVTPTVVNSLPTCNAGADGLRSFVTNNATAVAFAGAITTGGAIHTPVWCDGSASAWKQGALEPANDDTKQLSKAA